MHGYTPTSPQQLIITCDEDISCRFSKGDMCRIGNSQSLSVQIISAFSNITEITRWSDAISIQKSHDFYPLTWLFDLCNLSKVYRGSDHRVVVVFDVLQDQKKSIRFKTYAHETLIIVRPT
jgi:hypothetical protein